MKLSKQQQRGYNLLWSKKLVTARELTEITNYPSCLIRDLRKKGIEIKTQPVEGVNWEAYELINK